MKTTKTTNIDLVAELEAINQAGQYSEIIKKAKNNDYHCFKSETEEICPKTALVEDLSPFLELQELCQAVMNGDYDESPDEADNEMIRGWLREDGEAGERLIKVLGL